jgi:hypothetical integral membrane protein (TIGR02206 family)
MPDWTVFAPFSALHVVTVAICGLLVLAVVSVGRALRERGGETAFRNGLAIFALCYWFGYVIAWNHNGLDIDGGLPLHLCDFNGLVAPFALLTRSRWLRATLYFWTFTLTLQAFIQPELHEGPALAPFWAFWAGHTIIMSLAVYDLAVLGFRPDWSDVGRVLIVSLGYAAFVLPIDLALGVNYGFIGNPPPGKAIPPFIDAMGPWPRRAFIVIALAAVGFVLALLPWRLAAARCEPQAADLEMRDRSVSS